MHPLRETDQQNKKYCIHVLAWVFGDILLRNNYLNFVIDKFLTLNFFFMVKYIS